MSLRHTRSPLAGNSKELVTPQFIPSPTASSRRITLLTEGIPILNAQARQSKDGYGVVTPDRMSRWIDSQQRIVRSGGYAKTSNQLLSFTASEEGFSTKVLVNAWDPKGRYYFLEPVRFGESNTGVEHGEDQEGSVHQTARFRFTEDVSRQRPAFEMSGPYVRIGWEHRGLGVH